MHGAVRKAMAPRTQPQGHQHRVVGDRAQGEDRARPDRGDLLGEVAVAAPHFIGPRLVRRRQALHRVGDAAADELEAVVGPVGTVVTGETELVQTAVEQHAGVVAGEGPPGAVRAVHPRSKTHHQEPGAARPERRHRPRVVVGVLSSDPFEELGEPRAVPAGGVVSRLRNQLRAACRFCYRISPFFTEYQWKVLATEIRVGHLLEWEKRIWRVLKCYHVHVGGRGGAFMQVEMKDIETGTKTNQRIRTEDKVERAVVDPREMQYLYGEGDSFVFMDKENYEQLNLSKEFLDEQAGFLLPNTDVKVNFYNGRAIGVELPPSVVLEIVDTEPGIKNATVTTSFKPAKTETGLMVQVPPFVNNGEKIKVNTDDGAYIERV